MATVKNGDSRKNYRFTITTLVLVLGILFGYVVQAERLKPLLSDIKIQTIQNKSEIGHVQEKHDMDIKRIEGTLNTILEEVRAGR